MIALLLACAPPAPERVLGEDVPALILDGEIGVRLGMSVALPLLEGERLLAATAPGAGEVRLYDRQGGLRHRLEVEADPQMRFVDAPSGLHWLVPGQERGAFDGGEVERTPTDARALAICADGEERQVGEPGGAIACGPAGEDLRRTACHARRCEVRLDGVRIGTSSPGSALGFVDGVACWGDAALLEAGAPGALRCADGQEVEGEADEHLGLSLGAGRAGGRATVALRPMRARLLPLDPSRPALAVELVAEGSALALAEADDLLLVGAPGFPGRSEDQGRLFLVASPP